MIGKKRGRPRKAPANPAEEFPHLSGIWHFVSEITERIHAKEYFSLGVSEEKLTSDFERMKTFIGNALVDLIHYDVPIDRNVALGIVITAKSQFPQSGGIPTDMDYDIAIEIAQYSLECSIEHADCEEKYNNQASSFISFTSNYEI